MKLIIFYILFGMFFYQTSLLSQNHWKFINDNPPYVKVYSTCVTGNTAYFWGEENIVFKTSDSGETFNVLPQYASVNNTGLGCCSNHGIAFADSNNGYITDIAHGEFRTSDGGNTWLRTADEGSNIEFVEFGSPTVGWKVGDGGFYKTTNSGVSWTYISAPFFDGGIFSNIFALDDQNVWIVKSYYSGRNTEGSIWSSSDGGFSWRQLQTNLVSSEENQVTYSDILIKPSGIGIAIGEINRPLIGEKKSFIQKTSDLGMTWQTIEMPEKNLHNVISVDDSIWVIIGNKRTGFNNNIFQLRSTDNGTTWSEDQPFLYTGYNYMYSAAFIPKSNVILVSTLDGVYRSTDKGSTYSLINTNLGLYATAIALDNKPVLPDSQIIIAHSFNREYLLSKNAGRTWIKKEIPSNLGYEIWDLKISEGVIYIVVDQTLLYKSNNLGESWTQISVNYGGALRGLDVFDKNTLVLQSYPYLCTSDDGGLSWRKTPLGRNYLLNNSFMINKNKIISVGNFYSEGNIKGFIFKTSDGGFDWHISDLQNEAKIVRMITNNKGFVLSGSTLFSTNDAGDSWEPIVSGGVSAFGFKNSSYGLMHVNRSFMETKNGGNSWSEINMDYPFEFVGSLEITQNGNVLSISKGNLLFNPSINSPENQQIADDSSGKPCVLFQNSPNPFNPSTIIKYEIKNSGFVTLKIYDILGKEVSTLVNRKLKPGSYKVNFNSTSLSSGIYFYVLSTGNFSVTKKMVILK